MTNLSKIFICTIFIFFQLIGFSQALSPKKINQLVDKTMETFNVPGMAVAVIKDGEIILQKGYGIQSIATQKPVDTKTLFGIASNTKAFTSAAIAQLIDSGKLKWDTKVVDIIPEFKLYDIYVTNELTIRDLLSHRSGLGLGAGDLMVFPAQNKTTISELIYNLRYLKPASSFRSKFDYNNLFYIIAGEIVERVSGESYENYLINHFFKPLKMDRTTMDWEVIDNDDNRIDGHAPVNGELKITRRTFSKIGDPAAGIYTSIEDLTKWVQARLNYGKYGPSLQDSLFSHREATEMWRPQMIIPASKGDYNRNYLASGLGWFIQDVNGYTQYSHTGGLLGIVSQVIMIPDLDLGIIVLTNQESGAAFRAITNTILDGYLKIKDKDRINQYNAQRLENEKEATKVVKEVEKTVEKQLKKGKSGLLDDDFNGVYSDQWFGTVEIKKENNSQLRFISNQSPDLVGSMYYYKGTTYIVKWDDASLNADAFVNFILDNEGTAIGFKISPISPLTDFSYDFHDLDFQKQSSSINSK